MSERVDSIQSIGHVPTYAECKACGLLTTEVPMPHEPCPVQSRARELVADGYIALPASPEEFDKLVEAARGV